MISHPVSFDLPTPWSGQSFAATRFGAVNYLVGPNGSGKSRFAEALRGSLPNCRLLGTDRLHGLEKHAGLGIWGDYFQQGIAKNIFPQLKSSGQTAGTGVDALILLDERLDIRVRVEATLSHLFNRTISLEWDSGNMIPKAALGSAGSAYRLDRDECHGIKELLVLLTHLYNDEHGFLIIDEPELNLHPQFQAFLMQEVRKVAGDPGREQGKKGIFLVTHSPFTLDFRCVDDLRSVISFDIAHSAPRHLLDLDDAAAERLSGLVPRLNAHHKQFFFSDNPIFVEGTLDAQLVQVMQEARGVSVAGAGSCVIDAGGCDEVNKYVELCRLLGKSAYFLYDLDSLFTGNLRACIGHDEAITSFLAALGLGPDFRGYCGQLDQALTKAVNTIGGLGDVPPPLRELRRRLDDLRSADGWKGHNLDKGRIAVLVALRRNREAFVTALSPNAVADVEGRLKQVAAALEQRNVLLLTHGALEHYLPSYRGDTFRLEDGAKRNAVDAETAVLAKGLTEAEMASRYGGLHRTVGKLPGKPSVRVDAVIKAYLSRYIAELQNASLDHAGWSVEDFRAHLSQHAVGKGKLFDIRSFERGDGEAFSAALVVRGMLGEPDRRVLVSEKTNAGMRDFDFEP